MTWTALWLTAALSTAWALCLAWAPWRRALGQTFRHRGAELDFATPVLPCDACDRLVSGVYAHTHHHAPSCGIDDPLRERCRCDFLLCPGCCDCGGEAA